MTQGTGILFFNFGNDAAMFVRPSVSSSRFCRHEQRGTTALQFTPQPEEAVRATKLKSEFRPENE
jgi:hypothetical protein